MVVNEDTLNKIPEKDRLLVKALMKDVWELNDYTKNVIYIDWIDTHTEYSPERTDPCPDYYGMYRIINAKNYDMIGVEMDLDTLDFALCLLYQYVMPNE